MKYFQPLFIILFLLFFSITTRAQHKIIWEMAGSDTAAQRVLYKQLNNVLTGAPDTKIEVVFHGNAVYAMLKDTGYLKAQIMDLHKKGIVFSVCNNSLKARNIEPGRVIQEAVIVPSAIIEIVKKQEESWSYIKAGN
ncbi:MAG TPA: DsrE family protein [Ferruginibacter sp.]|nr:DsrE family protein [Ferruginibacter sp.]